MDINTNSGFKFEKLVVWQKAMTLGENINSISSNFPSKELYNLSSQIQRVADSIALNISEGAIVQSPPEYKKFLSYSIRLLAEVVTFLHKVKLREYISDSEFNKLYEFTFNLMNMLIAFRNTI